MYLGQASPRLPLCSPIFSEFFPIHQAQLMGGKVQGIDVFDSLSPALLTPIVERVVQGHPFFVPVKQFSSLEHLTGAKAFLKARLAQQKPQPYKPRAALRLARAAANTSALAFALGYDRVGSYSFKCASRDLSAAHVDTIDKYDPLLEGDMFITTGVMNMLRGSSVAFTKLDMALYFYKLLTTEQDPRTRRLLTPGEQVFFKSEKDLRLVDVYDHLGDAHLDYGLGQEEGRVARCIKAIAAWEKAVQLLTDQLALAKHSGTVQMIQSRLHSIKEKQALAERLVAH